MEFKWELIDNAGHSKTYRAKVHGGWLVYTSLATTFGATGSQTFVPDMYHEWEIEK